MNSALFTIDKTFHTSHFCGKRAGKGVLGVYQSTVEVYISLSQYIERGGGGGGGGGSSGAIFITMAEEVMKKGGYIYWCGCLVYSTVGKKKRKCVCVCVCVKLLLIC